MNIIYMLITITMLVVIMLIKKTEEKMDLFKEIIITIVLFTCYNMFVCYLFSLIKLPINLISLSIINLIIIVIASVKLIKDK